MQIDTLHRSVIMADKMQQSKASSDSLEVHKSVEDVAGSPTLCFNIGQDSPSDYCAVVITGNPGLIEFYEVFMQRLHKASKCRLQVVGVSQAGHSPIWKYNQDYHSSKYQKADYKSLADQVEHKIAFIHGFAPKNKKLILIGHSIGAYIVLKVLEDQRVQNLVTRSLLLFPTIERLTETPNGKFWAPVSYYFRHPFALTAFVLSCMPVWLQKKMVDWRTTWKGRERHPYLTEVFMYCMNYTLMNNALYMAACEMDDVTELDGSIIQTIEDNLDKITFYYGATDKWAPTQFYHCMKARFPDGDIRLCRNGFAHDFVVDSSEDVAELVWDMVCSLINDS